MGLARGLAVRYPVLFTSCLFTSCSEPALKIGEEPISMVKHTKYLGFQIDQHLLWDEHLSIITKKISRGLGMLKYSKKYLPLSTIQRMCKSLVEPYFRYCLPVWG